MVAYLCRTRFGIVRGTGFTLVIVAGVLATIAGAGAADAAAGSTTVAVTMTASKLVVSPLRVPGGTVVFKIVNRATVARTFSVAGKTAPMIAPGKSATLTVALPTGGTSTSHTARIKRTFSAAA
jgi:hypothetical protein